MAEPSMTATLRPYPRMKDSDVPWLGKVPAHWAVRRLRNVVDMRVSNVDKHTKEGELPVRLCNYVDVYKHDRVTEALSFMPATATGEEVERFRLERGDVLITKDSESWNDIGVPALVEYAADDLVCGYHLALLRPRKPVLSGAYLLRALQSPAVAYQFHIAANGVTRYGLSHNAIKSVRVPIPPEAEQASIVRFLDGADRRIRAYIRYKRRFIAFLNEQSRVVVHEAVTLGLDHSVRFKPSGVEWLGSVPEHWQVRRLKYLVPQVTVGIVIQPARLYVRTGVPALRSLNVSSGVIKPDHLVYISPESNRLNRKSQIHEGDIVVVRTGRAGTAAIVTEQFDGANCIDLLIIRKSNQVLSEYLLIYLNSWAARTNVAYQSVGAIQAHYNTWTLANLVMPVPPLAEQHALVERVAEELGSIDRRRQQAQRAIDLMRQYRARLIADVVTGKLDVREAAFGLAEEIAEGEEPPDVEEVETEEGLAPEEDSDEAE